MVKEITNYKCEICGMQFKSKDDAINCESGGVKKLLPIGTIFGMGYDVGMVYDGMVFAVIVQHPNLYRHHHGYNTWACRDTKAGDNCTEKNYCGMESWDSIFPPDKTIPAYQRMIKALKDANIVPIDYEG